MRLIPGFQAFDPCVDYNLDNFQCGIEHLDRFLKSELEKLQSRSLLKGYLLITDDEVPEVMGYYTLSGASFERGHLSSRSRKRIPYSNMPAVLLGRLAIDKRIQGKGFGELLIVDAIHKVRATAGQIGIYAMFVEAHDGAANFYTRMGFTSSSKADDSKTFFYPANQFDQLISGACD
ncbi:GNAT family N-acetyltransferase (plasmid) [Enterobacteriaceae bacterium Kacie_13]|nr:GNAT family N-acetyltransferase [Enterobacteriaceae bacterium Kacie_13]